jgi:hypothetical protein
MQQLFSRWIFLVAGLCACAPINASVSVPTPENWASQIFFPTSQDRDAACQQGASVGLTVAPGDQPKDLGKIKVNTSQGLVQYQSQLGYLYTFCAYTARITKETPKSFAVGTGVRLPLNGLTVDQVSVKVVLEDATGQQLMVLEPTSVTKVEEGQLYVFYYEKASNSLLADSRRAVAFSFVISRAGRTETHKVTSQQYSALGSLVTR